MVVGETPTFGNDLISRDIVRSDQVIFEPYSSRVNPLLPILQGKIYFSVRCLVFQQSHIIDNRKCR